MLREIMHSDSNNMKRSSILDRLMVPLLEAATTIKVAQIMHGQDSWRSKILNFIHTKRVQYTLAGLLVMDVLILFLELAIEAYSPSCDYVEKNGISCCPPSDYSDYESESYSCHHGLPLLEYPTTCDSEKLRHIELAEIFLFYCTVTILGIFMLELLTLVVVLGPREFFGHIFHTLDFIVVSVSLALELSFSMNGDAILEAVTGVLIFGRFWRFLRIGHGIFETAKEVINEKVERVVEYTEELEHLLQQHGIPLPEFKDRKSYESHQAVHDAKNDSHAPYIDIDEQTKHINPKIT